MANSISFIVEGVTDTRITITEEPAGTLDFEIETLNTGAIGDLRGVFFDVASVSSQFIDTLTATGETVTGFDADDGAVSNLGKGANVNGVITNALGRFDLGVAFGDAGIGGDDDLQFATFTLASTAGPLDIGMFSEVDLALRYTSVADGNGSRRGGEKLGGASSAAIIAEDDSLAVSEDSTDSVNVFANDENPAGTVLTGGDYDGAALALGPNIVETTGGRTGILRLFNDGNVEFSATNNDFDDLAVGETDDLVFTYTAMAPNGSTSCADVTITVTGINDPPEANPDTGNANENGISVILDALANDDDVDSDDDNNSLNIVDASSSLGSTVNVFSGGTRDVVVYTPDAAQFEALGVGDTVEDTVSYTIEDRHGAQDSSTIAVTVTGINDPVVAVNDNATVDELGPPTTISVFDNDIEIDAGDNFVIDSFDATSTIGNVSQGPNGNFEYDPAGQFFDLDDGDSAFDSFTYTLIDEGGATSTATVTVMVEGCTQQPTDRILDADAASAGTVLDNFFDDVTMSVRNDDDDGNRVLVDSVAAASSPLAGTGTLVFAEQSEVAPDGPQWESPALGIVDEDYLFLEFDNAVSAVAVDIFAADDEGEFALHSATVSAFDDSGTLLDSDVEANLGDEGDGRTFQVSSASGDIAALEVRPTDDSVGARSEIIIDQIVITELVAC